VSCYKTHRRIPLPKSLTVVGLGKLGLPIALCWATRGFHIFGVDTNPQVLEIIRSGKSPHPEPLVEVMLRRSQNRITFTNDAESATHKSDATFIIVPTPSEPDGSFSTRYVEEAIKPVAQALRSKSRFHLVIVMSTVLPGSMEGIIRPQLEAVSGKKCGVDIGLCYNPEFIALGDVVHGILTPDLVVIGESDPVSGGLLARMYETLCKNDPPVARMNFNNAELAKISVNVYVTMKITFANLLSRLCERLPEANVDEVCTALGLDSRIGRKYLKGGLSYGGPCFPRDNRAFSAFARRITERSKLSEVVDELNTKHTLHVSEFVLRHLTDPTESQVAILGLTYKPNTDVVEESASVDLAQSLLGAGVKLRLYDPMGLKNAMKELGDKPYYSNSIADCLNGSDLCVVSTPWNLFNKLTPKEFVNNMKTPTVLDCWRVLDQKKFKDDPRLIYLQLGVGQSLSESGSRLPLSDHKGITTLVS
jgi:UDPglucose 6-dehydrogenase